MTSNKSDLTEKEVALIERSALEYRGSVDTDEIKRIVEAGMKHLKSNVQGSSYNEWSAEERIAYSMIVSEPYFDKETIVPGVLISSEQTLRAGISTIQEMDDYWRFEPCVECIFEFDYELLEQTMNFFNELQESDYAVATQQYSNSIHDRLQDIREVEKEQKVQNLNKIMEDNTDSPEELPDIDSISSDIVVQYLEVYQELSEFFELAFPKLFALKRLLDGEEVDIDIIQSKKFTSIYHELTDSDELNSAYFDLIVKEYEPDLRNALAHGDYMVDSNNREIQLTTKEDKYSFSEIEETVDKNISNFVFLTGTLQSLIEWRYFTYDLDEISREILPI